MYQEYADSWYITLVFAAETLVPGSDVPKNARNLVHHSMAARKAGPEYAISSAG